MFLRINKSTQSDTLFIEIEIDNKVCQLYCGDELLTDDEALELSQLSEEDKARGKDMVETGLCQCSMCLGIRSRKAPATFRITEPRNP